MQNLRNKENMSDKIALCYWDYYNEGIEFYKKYIRLHQKLGNPVIFAGGAWTWNGIAPGISKALLSTKDALTACCEMRINDVFCTVWMDNGAETPLVTMLPILAVYGEYGFSKEPSKDKIAERFEFCFKMKWDNFSYWMRLIILNMRKVVIIDIVKIHQKQFYMKII